jgi:hypothetical protein
LEKKVVMGVLVIRTHMEMVDLVVMPRVAVVVEQDQEVGPAVEEEAVVPLQSTIDLLENSLLSLPEAEEVVVDLGIEVLKVHQMESVRV